MTEYICEFCYKKYSTKSNLNKHLKICIKKDEHDIILKFECEIIKYKEDIQILQKENSKQQKEIAKLQKENRDYEIDVAKLNTAKHILETNPRIINHNNYTQNTNTTNNNNIFLADINDSLLKQIAGKIPQDTIADGPESIGKYLSDHTDLFNNVYKSNPQLKTITYKTSNTKKLVKDNGAVNLAKMVIENMPNFDIENSKYFKPISKDTEDFYKNANPQYIKKLGLSIYEKALTETQLLDKQNNSKRSFHNFTNKLMDGIIHYIMVDINNSDTCLYYGMTGILCSLYRQGLTNAIDDNDKPSENFFDILHYLLSLCSLFFNRKFLDEIDSLEEEDPYYEITKSSHDDFLCWLKDSNYKLSEMQNTLESYKEINDDD